MSDGPQKENGYTAIANELLKAIVNTNFTQYEYKCVLFLMRMTYGWHKKDDAISLKQWADGTGIGKRHVATTLNGLAEKNVIMREKGRGRGNATVYRFNKHYSEWYKKVRVDAPIKKVHTDAPISVEKVRVDVPEKVRVDVPTKEKKESTTSTAATSQPKTRDEWFAAYEHIWGLTLTCADADDILEWKERVTLEGWKYALQEARTSNARNWRYLRSILRRIEVDGPPATNSSAQQQPSTIDFVWGDMLK
jgi:phage replication O-like protein O